MSNNTQFYAPSTLADAAALLRQHGPTARALAGGTDLVVHARSGRSSLPPTVVHLAHIPGLKAIRVDEDGTLHLGALVSHGEIETSPAILNAWTALCDASALVGSPATRHVGTVGGNLCNASPAMEIGGPLLAFDAALHLVGPDGERSVSIDGFFVAPGRTSRADDEILANIAVPALPPHSGSAYVRLEYRRAMEIAIVGATAVVTLDSAGAIAGCRIALTAIAPRIIRAPEAEQSLVGVGVGVGVGSTGANLAEALAQAGALAARASTPIDDVRAPAAYRRDMVKVITVRALQRAIERAQQSAS